MQFVLKTSSSRSFKLWKGSSLTVSTPDLCTADSADAIRRRDSQIVSVEIVNELFDLPTDELFLRARAVSDQHTEQVSASPIILSGACLSDPPCKHCKWRHFTVASDGCFSLDRTLDETIERVDDIVAAGVTRGFFATGWMGYRLPVRYLDIIAAVREHAPGFELFGLFGALDLQGHKDLVSAGLTGMLTSLESPNGSVFRSFRPGGDSPMDRLHALEYCQETGLRIWTGFLMGLGETRSDVASGIATLASFSPESVSILPFTPFPNTEMYGYDMANPLEVARAQAVARIVMPKARAFFFDHSAASYEAFASVIGLNGKYETSRR